ncbi:hypothetical protein ACFV1W_19020 [Kitasatospora sp. NPDC059648]|uniref:hypothetical protein n=1 Tax=Kitasatospora sp. NPDC059648 TaxID=3346894 RepID=UPI003678FC34
MAADQLEAHGDLAPGRNPCVPYRGELEEAVSVAGPAFEAERMSLPSLLMIAGELDQELRTNYPQEVLTRQFREQLVTIGAESKPALPF